MGTFVHGSTRPSVTLFLFKMETRAMMYLFTLSFRVILIGFSWYQCVAESGYYRCDYMCVQIGDFKYRCSWEVLKLTEEGRNCSENTEHGTEMLLEAG